MLFWWWNYFNLNFKVNKILHNKQYNFELALAADYHNLTKKSFIKKEFSIKINYYNSTKMHQNQRTKNFPSPNIIHVNFRSSTTNNVAVVRTTTRLLLNTINERPKSGRANIKKCWVNVQPCSRVLRTFKYMVTFETKVLLSTDALKPINRIFIKNITINKRLENARAN